MLATTFLHFCRLFFDSVTLTPFYPHWWFWEGPVITGLCISDKTKSDLIPFTRARCAVADPGHAPVATQDSTDVSRLHPRCVCWAGKWVATSRSVSLLARSSAFLLILSHLTRSVPFSFLQDVAEEPSSEKYAIPNFGFWPSCLGRQSTSGSPKGRHLQTSEDDADYFLQLVVNSNIFWCCLLNAARDQNQIC